MNSTTGPNNCYLTMHLPASIFEADYFDDISTMMFEIHSCLSDEVFQSLAELFPGSDTQ